MSDEHMDRAKDAAGEWNRRHGIGTRVRYRVGDSNVESKTTRPAFAAWPRDGLPYACTYVEDAGAPQRQRGLRLDRLEVVEATPPRLVPLKPAQSHGEAALVAALAKRPTASAPPVDVLDLPDPWTEACFTVSTARDGCLIARVPDELRKCDCSAGWRCSTYDTVRCWRCKAIEDREQAFDRLRIRATSKRAKWNLATLDVRLLRPEMDADGIPGPQPAKVVGEWLKTWAPGAPGWTLAGGTGRGKSHISAGLLRRLALVYGASCAWVFWPDLMARVKATFDDSSPESEADVLAPILLAQVVVLDDIRGQQTRAGQSPWANDLLCRLLEELGERQATVIANTNLLSLEALDQSIGERASSRLAELTMWLGIGGEDYRKHGDRQLPATQPMAPASPDAGERRAGGDP